MSALHVNDRNFSTEVLQAQGPVLVDFHAEWCGPCRMMGPVVDQLATELKGTVRVVKVNVDEAQVAASSFGVQSIPTFLVIENGELKERITGAVPKEVLKRAVEAYVPQNV